MLNKTTKIHLLYSLLNVLFNNLWLCSCDIHYLFNICQAGRWCTQPTSRPTFLVAHLLFVMLRTSTWHPLIQLNTITLDSHIILFFFFLRVADKHSWFCVKERVKSPLLIPGTTRSDWKVKETPHWSSSLMVFSLSGTLASCLVRSSHIAGHYFRSLQTNHVYTRAGDSS